MAIRYADWKSRDRTGFQGQQVAFRVGSIPHVAEIDVQY